jgi:hypothetical protein
MSRVIALFAVAAADVARSAWVMDAILQAERVGSVETWLAIGLIFATGGLSLGLAGLAGRAALGKAAPPCC